MTTGGQSLSFCVLVRADAGCLLLADPAVHQVAGQRRECPTPGCSGPHPSL